MMRRLALLPLALCCFLLYASAAERPHWPISGTEFPGASEYADFLQPTSSGKAESALFGCVRNDGKRFHEADDIAPVRPRRKGEATDPVEAIHDGVIVHLNSVAGNSSYGRYVVIEHSTLSLPAYSLYAHLASIEKSLAVGGKVSAGDTLGIMGRSAGGYSIPKSRAHLHFEIGLRLNDSFQKWYDQQGYTSKNHHGNFNGMNLTGWDPLTYFKAFQSGSSESVLEFFNSIPPAVVVHVRFDRIPEFLQRYPQLSLQGCEEAERKGWEVMLSAWGLPLSFRALGQEELRGVRETGDISVLAVDRNLLKEYDCRRIVSFSGNEVTLGSGGRHVLELLFMTD